MPSSLPSNPTPTDVFELANRIRYHLDCQDHSPDQLTRVCEDDQFEIITPGLRKDFVIPPGSRVARRTSYVLPISDTARLALEILTAHP